MAAAEEDFDTYLPVFLYSHASFAIHGEECKVAKPKVSGEITKKGLFKSFETVDDFFTTVPENMVLVDPIPTGLLCMSGWSVDELFPTIINLFGNQTFLRNDLPVYPLKYVSEIDPKHIDVLQHFYNNRKVYYSGDEINNYRITFDTNSGDVPWGIRIPIYENKDQKLFNASVGDYTIEMVKEQWSRQYSNAKNNRCIYLDEVLIKIREFVDEIYNHKPKIMLYLVSCRHQPDYDYIYKYFPEFKKLLLQRQLAVNINGINNVPYGTTTDRKLRGQETFTYDGDKTYQERLDKIQLESIPTSKRRSVSDDDEQRAAKKRNKSNRTRTTGGNRRYNDKRKTRKKKKGKKRKKAINVKKGKTRKGKQVKSN